MGYEARFYPEFGTGFYTMAFFSLIVGIGIGDIWVIESGRHGLSDVDLKRIRYQNNQTHRQVHTNTSQGDTAGAGIGVLSFS